MSTIHLKYNGHNVWVVPPESGKIAGKYTITVGTLVQAHPVIRKPRGSKRYKIYWDRHYGKRFLRLLSGAFREFLRENF